MTLGTAGGIMLGAMIFRPTIANPIMKSIACLTFGGKDVSFLTYRLKCKDIFSKSWMKWILQSFSTNIINLLLVKFQNVSLCKTNLPRLSSTADILIRVRAASINRLDYRISQGYGRTLRSIFQGYNKYNKELPLIIGRSCSGVVESVGKDAQSGLEIGDEVWLATHFYEIGVGK